MAPPATPARRRLVPGNLLTPPSTERRRRTTRRSAQKKTNVVVQAPQNLMPPPPPVHSDAEIAASRNLLAERMAHLLSWDHNPLQADPEDCAEDHTFLGQQRPPVGVSLQEIVTYLSTPRVFESADWPVRSPYIAKYLDFLEEGGRAGTDNVGRIVDDAGQLLPQPPPFIEYAPPVIGSNTRTLLREARRLLQVQQLFETHVHGLSGKRVVLLTSAAAVPRTQPRQLRLSHLVPAAFREAAASVTAPVVPDAVPVEVPATPEADAPVNRVSQYYPQADEYKQQMVDHDNQLVGQPEQPGDTVNQIVLRARRAMAAAAVNRNNLSYEENTTYFALARQGLGWVTHVRAAAAPAGAPPGAPPLIRQLPDGTVLARDAISYARERGARRAALQLALFNMPSSENTAVSASSPWHRVALPAPVGRIHRRLAAAASHWRPSGQEEARRPATVPTRWQAVMEDDAAVQTSERRQTHPYTTCMAAFRRHRQQWMEQARAAVEQKNEGNADWVPLPHFFDAYCRQPQSLSRSDVYDRRMLALLRTLARQMERAGAVAPRPLLKDVRKYAEQGLHGQAEPDELLKLRSPYDWRPQAANAAAAAGASAGPSPRKRVRAVRPLVEAEARWLQFLLTPSTNRRMVLPLPPGADLREPYERVDDREDENREEDEEGDDLNRQALYQCFARRFQACMDDLSATRLFQTARTEVSVQRLVDWLNGQDKGRAQEPDRLAAEAALAGPSPVPTRVHFSYSDGRFFCARLSRAGRCRYMPYKYASRAGNHGGGVVMRPPLSLHPEHRLWNGDLLPAGAASPGPSWLKRQAVAGEKDVDMAIGAPRRGLEVDTSWLQTVVSGRADQPLADGVRTFFCALAFRFGLTLRLLERKEAGRAESEKNNGYLDRTDAMRAWKDEYDRLTKEAHVHFDLVDVARAADPTASPDLTLDEARKRIRHGLLVEAEQGRLPVASSTTDPTMASLWDWGQPEVCGEAPAFFHLDRWPQHLQLPQTRRLWMRNGGLLDPDAVWDPASQDPTPAAYLWQSSSETKPFGFQKVKYRPGPAAFIQGETRLQRQAIIDELTDRVARELGYGEFGFWDKLASYLPYSQRVPQPLPREPPTIDDIVVEETRMPAVSASRIPHSVDWKGV